MKMNIKDSIVFAIVLRVCICFVAYARVGKPLFMGIAIAVTAMLYIYLRKGNKQPYVFIATMAVTHIITMALLVISDRFVTSHFMLWPDWEMILAGYMAVILIGDIVITKIRKHK
ncbi:MAG: hypothetical protein E7616_08020 [Ruminococcaceae bacterium]|nr:hypothetical protein [Oscillospiraceae bacterium]